jgi:hypothetical protein
MATVTGRPVPREPHSEPLRRDLEHGCPQMSAAWKTRSQGALRRLEAHPHTRRAAVLAPMARRLTRGSVTRAFTVGRGS